MKKYIITCVVILLLTACGNEQSSNEFHTEEVVASKYADGASVYKKTCIACHQAQGNGVVGAFPPLAKSDYLMADKNRAIKQIINGSGGEMIVNGETYNSIMPAQELTDEEVRDVMNYILNAWGNNGGEVTLDDVQKAK